MQSTDRHRQVRIVVWTVGIAIAALVVLMVASVVPRIQHARRQAPIVARILAIGGEVKYDFQIKNPRAARSPLQQLLGDDFFGDVVEVDFSNSGVSDKDFEILRGLPAMNWLGLYETRVTDQGLAQIGTLTQLEFLWLDSTPITDRRVARLVGLSNLKKLLLQYTAVTDAAMVDVAKLGNFRELALAETAITDEGIRQLTSLRLESLKLDGTKVTDASAPSLARFTGLKQLDLFNTQITD